MKPFLTSALSALLVCSVSLAGYHRFVVAPAQRVAVVDLESVLSDREAILQRALIKADSEQERARIQAMASAFPQLVHAAVEELAVQCDCVILERTVLLVPRPGTVDLTAELRQKVAQ